MRAEALMHSAALEGREGRGARRIESPIRVCVVTGAYPAPSEPTRAIFIENLCRELASLARPGGGRRFLLSVVAPRIKASDPRREMRSGIRVRRFAYPSGGKRLKELGAIPRLPLLVYLLSAFAEALREVLSARAAVIHCHWVLPAGLIGALLGRVAGIPQVFHAHGSDIHYYAQRSPLARALARWALSRASRVAAVSGPLAEELEADFGVPRERIVRLPMGIDSTVFTPLDREGARRTLGLSGEKAELLLVADWIREKGVLELGRALVESPASRERLRLNLVGGGPHRPLLEALALKAPARLRLLGRLRPPELSLWYRAADLLVLPSRGEGTPVSVMEALTSGLPVVATDVGGVPEIVRPGREGWLAPAGASGEEFLEVVERALGAPSEIERMRAWLGARGEDRSASLRARELADLLEEVVQGEDRERG